MTHWPRVVPALLSSAVLAAHFWRAGSAVLAAASIVAPPILLLRRPWGPSVLRWILFAGSAVWLETAFRIVRVRRLHGQPSLRMLAILLFVAAFTALSGYLLGRDQKGTS